MKSKINYAIVATTFLAGVVVAAMTIVPGMASVNDSLTCFTGGCEDLAAQRSMALAAWAMVAVTILSLLIALVTMLLAYFAYLATRDSARTAKLQAAISEDLGRRQVRAYLSVTDAWLDLKRSAPQAVILTIKNTGHTPARRISATFTLTIDSHQWPSMVLSPLEAAVDYVAAENEEPLELHFSANVFTANPSTLVRVKFEGVLRYEDAFGVEDKLEVNYRLTRPAFENLSYQMRRSATQRSL